ncbi:hypothetical protein [Rubellimicrobium arenae]|uniref:hypothetical protein n=1 Tax=Rubellimicrobium arenae TaxID=2817372 RepID=UPI001B30DD95|nr:hypothetical protein [Rubellimicrobium arenae]
MSDTEWSSALAELAPLCEEVTANGAQMWMMRSAERGRELAALAERPEFVARLYRQRPPLRHDVFATILQRCLSSGPLPVVQEVSAADLREAISAAIFAGSMVLDPRRDAIKAFEQALYRRVAAESQAARMKAVLPRPLVGRVEERTALLDFLRHGLVRAPFQQIGDPVDGRLLLTGSPGIGKSAFLADVLQTLRSDTPKTYAVHFDFDQLTLMRGSVVAWAEELTRQIGSQWADAEPLLSRVRAEHSRRRLGRSAASVASSAESDAAALVEDAWKALSGIPLGPIAIVADTIEEITARDSLEQFEHAPQDTRFSQLLDWVRALRDISVPPAGPFSAVRLLASGRTAPPVDRATLAQWFAAVLDLPDLDDDAADAMLTGRDASLEARSRARIIAAVGGHPLHLLMVQQHITGLRPTDRAALLAELEVEGLRGALPETVTRTLYSRFIDRLRIRDLPAGLKDDDIRKLARSGLLLREVTEPLLAEVVGLAAKVALSGPGLAKAALTALREQVWLVVPGERGSIRHRPDVRRVMLPMVLSRRDPAIRALLDAAVAWFEDRPLEVGAIEEAGYLRALRGDPEDVAVLGDPSRAASVLSLAGGDLAVMPLVSQAILKFTARPAEPLSAAELAALPEPRRVEALARQESAALRSFGGTKARPGVQAAPVSLPVDQPGRSKEPTRIPIAFEWSNVSSDAYDVLNNRTLHDAVEVAFLESDFGRVAELGWTAIRHVSRWPDLTRPLSLSTPFEMTWLWRSMLAFAVRPPSFHEAMETPLITELLAEEKKLEDPDHDVRASAPDEPFFYEARFDLLPLLHLASIPRELRHVSVPPWRSYARLNDLRELRLAASIPGLRHALAHERFVAVGVPSALPLLAEPLVDPVVRKITSGAGTNLPAIVELVLSAPSNPHLLDELSDRLDDVFDVRDVQVSVSVNHDDPVGRRSLAAMLRGTTPELHATIVASLLRLPPTAVIDTVEEISRSARFWPSALSQLVSTSSELGGRSRAPVLRRLVRWLDLCRLLDGFLADLAARMPAPEVSAQIDLLRTLDRLWQLEPGM